MNQTAQNILSGVSQIAGNAFNSGEQAKGVQQLGDVAQSLIDKHAPQISGIASKILPMAIGGISHFLPSINQKISQALPSSRPEAPLNWWGKTKQFFSKAFNFLKPVVGGIANSFIPGLGNTITGAADAIGRGIDSLGGDRVKQSNPPPEVKRLGRRY